MSSLIMFPAIRTLKMSPSPWSKISSAEVLLSMQLSITANGCCPSEVSFACCNRLRLTFRLFTNRLLPSFNRFKAIEGVMAACISFVNVFIFILFFMISEIYLVHLFLGLRVPLKAV